MNRIHGFNWLEEEGHVEQLQNLRQFDFTRDALNVLGTPKIQDWSLMFFLVKNFLAHQWLQNAHANPQGVIVINNIAINNKWVFMNN